MTKRCPELPPNIYASHENTRKGKIPFIKGVVKDGVTVIRSFRTNYGRTKTYEDAVVEIQRKIEDFKVNQKKSGTNYDRMESNEKR